MRNVRRGLLMALLWAGSTQAHFYAAHSNGSYYWYTFEMKQLVYQIDMQGLFYRTTIVMEPGITHSQTSNQKVYPLAGAYEMRWDFSLPAAAVITDCQMQPTDSAAGHFIAATMVDLSTAEAKYHISPSGTPQLLLRQCWYRRWDGTQAKSYRLNYFPVHYSPNMVTKSPVIKISYLTPCTPRFNARRLSLIFDELCTNQTCPLVLRFFDPDNPSSVPAVIVGFNSALDWTFVNGYWQATSTFQYCSAILQAAPENDARNYLRIFANDEAQFYQLAILPPLPPEARRARNILFAIDATEEGYNCFNFSSLVNVFREAVRLATSSCDSIAMIYSGFTTVVYDSKFQAVSPAVLAEMFDTLAAAPVPRLNTLPHLLRQAVQFFNNHRRAGEIWLLTNARTHSEPPATALEIIDQSLNNAKYPLLFRIINNDWQTWPSYYINHQYYPGNDYLYENLARLSKGSFVKLRTIPNYDALDLMLDCIAPAATSVEIDPEPSRGLSYSRFPLNEGRVNFPITWPYYEIGLFDGTDPFTLHFFSLVDGHLYARDVCLHRQPADPGWQTTATFWYARYVQNLLLEPQSYATIKYIETTSVQQRLLTVYSGFIIPGPGGVAAFQRLEAADELTVVHPPPIPSSEWPQKFTLAAYPNPFNPETTLSFDLPTGQNNASIAVKIFNCQGQLIYQREVPIDNELGKIQIHWDGKDHRGQTVASGIYLVTAMFGKQPAHLKITRLR